MNKLKKSFLAILVLVLSITVLCVKVHPETILPDFVITDISVTPEIPHLGDTVVVKAMLGNQWPLAIGEINLIDVEVSASVNDDVYLIGYEKTGCANNACPPDIPGAPCAGYASKCPIDPGFEWDRVLCQWLSAVSECRCVYYKEVYYEFRVETPGFTR